jgi:hypothetical protein
VNKVDRKFTSLLEELSSAPIRNKEQFIEHRAEQAIAAIQNLRKLLRESFAEEAAADLDKRLMNAIKTDDAEKFRRGLKAHKKGE